MLMLCFCFLHWCCTWGPASSLHLTPWKEPKGWVMAHPYLSGKAFFEAQIQITLFVRKVWACEAFSFRRVSLLSSNRHFLPPAKSREEMRREATVGHLKGFPSPPDARHKFCNCFWQFPEYQKCKCGHLDQNAKSWFQLWIVWHLPCLHQVSASSLLGAYKAHLIDFTMCHC